MKSILFLLLFAFISLFSAPVQACSDLDYLSGNAYLNISIDADLQRKRDKCILLPVSFEKLLCLNPYFKEVTRKYSADLAIIQAEEMKNLGIIDDCHLVAHTIGKANVHKFDYNMNKIIATCPLNCIQGCMHGAMQTYISEKVKPEDLPRKLVTICDDVKDDALMRYQCVHGVGHGFMTNDYMTVEKGIEACSLFSGPEIDVCLGGLIMENMQRYLLLSDEEFRAKLPVVCAEIINMGTPSHIATCHDAVGEGLMFRTAHNLKESLKLCDLVSPDKKYRRICQTGAVNEGPNVPVKLMTQNCNLPTVKAPSWCQSNQGQDPLIEIKDTIGVPEAIKATGP